MPEQITIERRGAVALITLARPERKNAWTPVMGSELFQAIHDHDRDDATRAIVIAGAGGAFCAGADLAAGGETFADRRFASYRALEERVMPWKLATPVIAAIDGPAIGVGATVPLLFDLRVASERARIGFVFPKRGLCPEANSTWLLPRLIGASRAMDLLLTGRIVDAQEALAIGLVSRVVPAERLLDEALAIAESIAAQCAPVAVGLTKRLVWRQLSETDPVAAKAREDRAFHWIGRHRDVAEGIAAFLEKRAPRWSGTVDEIPDVE